MTIRTQSDEDFLREHALKWCEKWADPKDAEDYSRWYVQTFLSQNEADWQNHRLAYPRYLEEVQS